MRKTLILIVLIFPLAFSAMAQEAQAEPSTTQRIAFYALTGAGVLFLYLAFRRSKWGRRQ